MNIIDKVSYNAVYAPFVSEEIAWIYNRSVDEFELIIKSYYISVVRHELSCLYLCSLTESPFSTITEFNLDVLLNGDAGGYTYY